VPRCSCGALHLCLVSLFVGMRRAPSQRVRVLQSAERQRRTRAHHAIDPALSPEDIPPATLDPDVAVWAQTASERHTHNLTASTVSRRRKRAERPGWRASCCIRLYRKLLPPETRASDPPRAHMTGSRMRAAQDVGAAHLVVSFRIPVVSRGGLGLALVTGSRRRGPIDW